MDSIPVQGDLDRIAESLNPIHLDWVSIVTAIAVLVGAILMARIARKAVRRLGARVDIASRNGIDIGARMASYAILGMGAVAALRVVGIDLGPLIAGFGLVALVLAVAARPFLENLAAGLTIQMQGPIEVTDQVQLSGIDGTVLEMTSRTVVLDTVDGRRVFIPNRTVLEEPITNYTVRGGRRTSLDVGVAYDTDLMAAANLIVEATKATPGVRQEPDPEVFIHEFGDSTINATVRFWHDPGFLSVWVVRHEVAVNLKRVLDDAGMVIAFPQRVIWNAQAN